MSINFSSFLVDSICLMQIESEWEKEKILCCNVMLFCHAKCEITLVTVICFANANYFLVVKQEIYFSF